MDAAGEFLFGASDLNTLDLPLPIAGQAQMGPKGTSAEGGYGSFVTAFEKALILHVTRSRLGRYMWPFAEISGDKARPYRKEIDFWIQPLLDIAFSRREQWTHLDAPLSDQVLALFPHLDSESRFRLRVVIAEDVFAAVGIYPKRANPRTKDVHRDLAKPFNAQRRCDSDGCASRTTISHVMIDQTAVPHDPTGV